MNIENEELPISTLNEKYIDYKLTSENVREAVEYFWDKFPNKEVFHHYYIGTDGENKCYMYIFDREHPKEIEIDNAVEHIIENYLSDCKE